MSGLLAKLLSKSAAGLVAQTGAVIDKFVTTKEEKMQAKQGLAQLMTRWASDMQGQLTERLRIDMASDSWLSKNIRPLTLIFILAMYSLLSVLDGTGAGVVEKKKNVQLLGEWGRMIFIFYFGGRTAEKGIEIVQKYKTDRTRRRDRQ